MSRAAKCPSCGVPGTGSFCSACGSSLREPVRELACPSCGSACEADALFCSECGAPVAARPARSVGQRLPWILSGLALVAFAVAITLAIGESTSARDEGMPPTGAVIPSPGSGSAAGPADRNRSGSGDPSSPGMDPGAIDLDTMTGREAADRLFDRAMRTEAAGDTAGARFFAEMGVRAYGALSPSELDADARFHVGLLELMRGNTAAAAGQADAILAGTPAHLLGLILRARLAAAASDAEALAAVRRRFAAAYPAERAAGRTGYEQHAALIAEEARIAGATP